MSEALEKAKRNYEKNRRIKKTVSFNCETDRKRLNFTESINFSEWVKKKIDEEIAESEKLAKSCFPYPSEI